MHHILFRCCSDSSCDQKRVQNQTHCSDSDLICPVLYSHFDERSSLNLLQGNSQCLIEPCEGSKRALFSDLDENLFGHPGLLCLISLCFMEKEFAFLGSALEKPGRPFVAIVGGAKVSDKMAVLDRLIDKAWHLKICYDEAKRYLGH
jgi:hypothetical protein